MSKDETFLVTGALGCIGAWTCIELVREGIPVVAFDLGADRRRLELIASPKEVGRISFVRGDVTELGELEAVLSGHAITNVVHLAALQVPFCKADPVLGARVNVVGTVNVFEAAKKHGVKRLVYASSIAALPVEGGTYQANLYGVYKAADEGIARIYAQDWGVASVGLRPHTV